MIAGQLRGSCCYLGTNCGSQPVLQLFHKETAIAYDILGAGIHSTPENARILLLGVI